MEEEGTVVHVGSSQIKKTVNSYLQQHRLNMMQSDLKEVLKYVGILPSDMYIHVYALKIQLCTKKNLGCRNATGTQ